MPKTLKALHAPVPATPDARGQWLVLIGDPGETSTDEIEAFFADMWPDVGPSDDGGPGVTVEFRGVH